MRGLVLTNTPLLRTRGRSRAGFHTQRAMLSAGLSPGRYGRIAATSLYGRDHRRRHPEVIAETGRTVAALGRRGTLEIIDRVLLQPADVTDLLARLTIPAVLVAGEQDYVGSPEVRSTVAAAGHELRSHPGGHMGPAEAPEHLAHLLRELADTVSVLNNQVTT